MGQGACATAVEGTRQKRRGLRPGARCLAARVLL